MALLATLRAAVLERPSGRSVVDAVLDAAGRLVVDVHPFTKWTVHTEHYFRMIRASPSLMARVRELRELLETDLEAALLETKGARKDDATARILAVSMVAAWRAAHRTAMSARDAGERGDALGNVFLRALDDALEPVRRAARGTVFAAN